MGDYSWMRQDRHYSGGWAAGPGDDLNKAGPLVDDENLLGPTARRNMRAMSDVEVFFSDIEDNLVRFIQEADVIIGCVAWLTNYRVLDALAAKKSVSIIVQKEDFLRPEKLSKQALYNYYSRLKGGLDRHDPGFGLLPTMSYAGDPSIDPIRCVGNHNRDKKPAFPRMHNKFIIACSFEGENDEITAKSVWTGSFNFSYNATQSLENAVVLHDRSIAQAYLDEYERIAALSEPLNWTDDWCAPEWRIGS